MVSNLKLLRLPTTLALLITLEAAAQQQYRVVPEKSLFAVVIYKSGFGHNHLVPATDYDTTIDIPEGGIRQASFSFRVPAANLRPDDPKIREQWLSTLRDAGIEVKFGDLDQSQRADVRESMLGGEQLHAEKFADITAEVKSITERDLTVDGKEYTHAVELAFTVHGETVEKTIPARINKQNDSVTVQAVAPYKFTDFDIEPYSALFGLARNKDEFTLVVHMTAEKDPSPET